MYVIGHVSEVWANCTFSLKMSTISLFSGHFQPFGHVVFNVFFISLLMHQKIYLLGKSSSEV